ncbi:MBL fold metallo-hydrolase, partial [Xanthomonas citri pv. citri]|nr:MBL fold metallo-hydrolase [Xanthomonas citri pv. citri]
MNLRQLSEHVFQCEFELDVPLRIPVHTWFI